MLRCDGEDRRVTPRYRLALIAGAVALSGCGDAGVLGPLHYNPSENLTTDLKGKPNLQVRVQELIGQTFGATTDTIRVPPGGPHPPGRRLPGRLRLPGQHRREKSLSAGHPRRFRQTGPAVVPAHPGRLRHLSQAVHALPRRLRRRQRPDRPVPLAPSPRLPHGRLQVHLHHRQRPHSKPTREDLRRTLHHGIPNTSMPAFETLLTAGEIEQVIDYVMFLEHARRDRAGNLIYLAMDIEDKNARDGARPRSSPRSAAAQVFMRLELRRVERDRPQGPARSRRPARASLRGRQLFLGEKGLQCAGCHGLDAKGNGESFVAYDLFNARRLRRQPRPGQGRGTPEDRRRAPEEVGRRLGRTPPARQPDSGVYKGGRRPIDIYWRIAKGINGTPMPAHLGTRSRPTSEIWDLVNFVLALPYEPELLKGRSPSPAHSLAPAVTQNAPASRPASRRLSPTAVRISRTARPVATLAHPFRPRTSGTARLAAPRPNRPRQGALPCGTGASCLASSPCSAWPRSSTPPSTRTGGCRTTSP